MNKLMQHGHFYNQDYLFPDEQWFDTKTGNIPIDLVFMVSNYGRVWKRSTNHIMCPHTKNRSKQFYYSFQCGISKAKWVSLATLMNQLNICPKVDIYNQEIKKDDGFINANGVDAF